MFNYIVFLCYFLYVLQLSSGLGVSSNNLDIFEYVYCKDKNNDTILHNYDTIEDWVHNIIFLEPITRMKCNTSTISQEDKLFLQTRSKTARTRKQLLVKRRPQRQNFCKTKQNFICPIAKIKCGICSFFVPSVLCSVFCLKVNTLCELTVLSC